MAITRAQRSKLSGRQAELQRTEFTQLASGTNLTPASITSILRTADSGDTRRLVEAVCDVRGGRDLHLIGVEQTRRAAVAGKPWELRPGRRLGRETPDEVVQACLLMLEGIPTWPDLIGAMQDAVTQPLYAAELAWEFSEGQAWIVGVDWVHAKRFRWNTALEDRDIALGELRLITDTEPMRGVRLLPDRWLIHQVVGQADYPWRCGLGRALLWYEAFKAFSWKQWAIWLEVCATPMRLASVPEQMSEDDRAAVSAALEALGSDSFGVVSDTAKVEFVSGGQNGGDQSYERMVAAVNTEISKAVLGHAGSADTTPGRLGGESLAGEIRQDLVEADARAIEATIQRCLLEPFVRINFGAEIPVPRLHLQVDAQVSRRETMLLAKEAWTMGLPVDREWLASSTGVQLTTDPAKMLPPPGPQVAAQTVAGATAPQPNANPAGGAP